MCGKKSFGTANLKRIWRVGCILLLLSGSITFAQMPTATILGVVRDSSGAVVPGVELTARNVNTGQTRTGTSESDGSYRFSALPVGTYEVRAEHPGFQTAVRSGLTLSISQEAVINFSLEVGAVEQTVAVTAEAPLVNTTSGSLGGLVDEQKVAELPLNGRNYIDLTLLQTGVVQHKNANQGNNLVGVLYSSNGAPLRSNNLLLDGAIMRNSNGASSASISGTTLGVEGIREYRVVTSSFSAEYGMNMGSQMVIVSKGGTNTFHGSLFEYLRNSALDARNFFDYTTVASRRRLPPFKRNNFGGSIGGPLKKDRTFFFGVYETVRERKGTTQISNTFDPALKVEGAVGGVPVIAPIVKPWLAFFPSPNLPGNRFTFPFSQPTTEHYGQMRVDQTISSADTAFARYTVDDADQVNPGSYPDRETQRHNRSQFATLSENHVFTPSLLNTFRFSYSRTAAYLDNPTGIIGPQYTFVPGKEMGAISIGGVTGLSGGSDPNGKKQNIFSESEDLFYTRGRHSLKFGTLINRFQQYTLNLASVGTISFANPTNFLLGQATSYQTATPGAIQSRTYHFTTFGFYVQDDFRVRSNLNLNLGLRYEFNTQLQETNGLGAALRDMQHDANTTLGPPAENNSLKNFGPRIGFAWDVMGNGQTAVRGGFGLLYDIAVLADALSAGAQSTPPFSGLSNVSRALFPNLVNLTTLPLFIPPEAAGKALRTLDYHAQQPHMLQYNLALERQLPGNMVVTVAYGGSRGINILRIKDGNPTVPLVLADGRQFWPNNPPRTNPNWNSSIELKTMDGNSFYNSLQVGLSKRLSHGLQFQSSYTWSKTIDETQGTQNVDNTASASFGADPTHRSVDRGLAAFDVAQNWRFNAIYHFPGLGLDGIQGKLLNGWWVSGILSLQSGYPLTPALNTNRSRSGVNNGGSGIDRPDLVTGRSNGNIVQGTTAGCRGVAAGQKLGGTSLYFDPCAFAIPTVGFLGTAGRNILLGPGFANVDFSLVKDTALRFLGEGGKLEFRAEIFNILNRANFAEPNRTVFAAVNDVENPLGNVGQITSTSGASRQIQFGLKILF